MLTWHLGSLRSPIRGHQVCHLDSLASHRTKILSGSLGSLKSRLRKKGTKRTKEQKNKGKKEKTFHLTIMCAKLLKWFALSNLESHRPSILQNLVRKKTSEFSGQSKNGSSPPNLGIHNHLNMSSICSTWKTRIKQENLWREASKKSKPSISQNKKRSALALAVQSQWQQNCRGHWPLKSCQNPRLLLLGFWNFPIIFQTAQL